MSLAIVTKPNPYFDRGTWLEGTDEGWQKAVVETRNNRLHVVTVSGMIFDKQTIAPFIMHPQRSGLDK